MKILVMAFDGETKLEKPEFSDTEKAWAYADDLGSKWYFYPFYFVVSNSGQTIKDAPAPLACLIGKRVRTAAKLFKHVSNQEDSQGHDPDEFAYTVADSIKGGKRPC